MDTVDLGWSIDVTSPIFIHGDGVTTYTIKYIDGENPEKCDPGEHMWILVYMDTHTGGVKKTFQCMNCLDEKLVNEPHFNTETTTGDING
jgi:hypothetical protein